jgi:hypothetical protein
LKTLAKVLLNRAEALPDMGKRLGDIAASLPNPQKASMELTKSFTQKAGRYSKRGAGW